MRARRLGAIIAAIVVVGCSGQASPTAAPTVTPTAAPTAAPTVTPTASSSPIATAAPSATVTAVATATAVVGTSPGAWLASGSMITPRGYHTATLLADGRVLVVGGVAVDETTGPEPTRSVEFYDPRTGAWTSTERLPTPRWYHTATRLEDGTVLVVGGAENLIDSPATDRADIFDPATGTWSPAGPLIAPRQGHTATLLVDGGVIVVGGSGSHGDASPRTVERYDPPSRTWTVVGELPIARWEHSATGLRDGSILVAGGFDSDLRPLDTLVGSVRGDRWTPTDRLVQPRHGHTATQLADGSVLVAGGADAQDTVIAFAERYAADARTWEAVDRMFEPRDDHAAVRLADATVLVSGGRSSGDFSAAGMSAERFDPAAGDWFAAAAMSVARYVHTLTLLDDGSVLAAGGSGPEGMVAVSERFVSEP